MLTDRLYQSSMAAKIRVMYGRRITKSMYDDLIKKRTVTEIAAELKESEAYSEVLSGIDPNLIHRDQLESLLRKNLFSEHLKILKYSFQDDKILLGLLLKKYEMDQIISFIRFLKSGRTNEFIYSIPKYIMDESAIRFEALSAADSYEGFLEIIKPSVYHKLLKNLNFESDDFLTAVEAVLYTSYYAFVFRIIKSFGRTTGSETLRSIGSKIDILNIIHIIRLKKYYNAGSLEILKQIIPHNYRVTKQVLKEMAEAKTVEDVFELINKTVYQKLFSEHSFSFIEEYLYQLIFDISYKFLIFGEPSVAIPVSYLNFKEIEIKNLITIIEGKRYQLKTEEITEHLIGV